MDEEKYLFWLFKFHTPTSLKGAGKLLQLWGLISAGFPGNPYRNRETDEGLSEGDQEQLVQSGVVQMWGLLYRTIFLA